MINLHTVTGADLPDLVWHHTHLNDPVHLVKRWRTPMYDGWHSKPLGGLFTSVVHEDERGQRVSSWAEFNDETQIKDHPYVSTLVPDQKATFVVIDSCADAVAAVQAFPGQDNTETLAERVAEWQARYHPDKEQTDPMALVQRLMGGGGSPLAPSIDWTLLEQHQHAGMYLTARGRIACTQYLPGVPDFWGWDVPQVWFRAPLLHVMETSRSLSV